MPTKRHAALFENLRLGRLVLRNRIVVPPMYQIRSLTSPAGLAWYRRFAAGGAGLVIVEGTSAFRFAKGALTPENLKPLVDAIHQEGAAAVVQLFPLTSGWPSEPAALSRAQIEEMIRACGIAGEVCRAAGFDGVEPHGAHGFALNRFFMPDLNQRRDEFGGSFENRIRMGLRIVEEIRRRTDPEFLVFYRHTPVGTAYSLEESLAFAKALVAAGVQVLDISPAKKERVADLAAPFKALGVPVIAVNGMDDPDAACEALKEKRCDLVGLGRQLIADAEWPRKIREGRFDEIVTCLKCDQGCYGRISKGAVVECEVWPDEVTKALR
jgi:2,4-dienoyl-CoA reductase-like NADH-dependent reductase (Old Yellow Enzyme family)